MNEQWRILMETSPVATWFQSEEAYRCFESCNEWLEPFLVQVHRETRLVGSVLGYVTKERCCFKQFFTSRAVIFGGPLLAEDITDAELLSLLNNVKTTLSPIADSGVTGTTLAPIYIEIRNFNDYSQWRHVFEEAGWTYLPHYDIHIDCRDKETMINRVHESKLRAVRKAKTEGQEIVEATTEEQVRAWYKQLYRLYKTKVHRPLWPLDFFLQVWKEGYAKLLVLQRNGLSVEGGLFGVRDNKTLYEWYICGAMLVTYGALEYAADNGLERFDLMGAGEPGVPYGVRDFKMQFGGELKEPGRFLIICKPLLYKLGKAIISLSSKHSSAIDAVGATSHH